MSFPTKAKYVLIGAGIHSLSTAWHLAEKIKKNGNGSNNDIVVIDKGGIASGASGIACGVVRNNYFQPAMRELMAHSVASGKAILKLLAITRLAICRFRVRL